VSRFFPSSLSPYKATMATLIIMCHCCYHPMGIPHIEAVKN
jgi:hypothetical protein